MNDPWARVIRRMNGASRVVVYVFPGGSCEIIDQETEKVISSHDTVIEAMDALEDVIDETT